MANACSVCKKTNSKAWNRPKSLHCTRRTIKPNLQKKDNTLVCTRCLRTKNKKTKQR